MKKSLIILIIGVGLCVIGGVFIVLQGGLIPMQPFSKEAYQAWDGNVEWYNEPVGVQYAYDVKDVTDIEVDLVTYKIDVEPYDGDTIQVEYQEYYKDAIRVSQSGGKLSFKQPYQSKFITFDWLVDLWRGRKYPSGGFIMKIPRNAGSFHSLTVDTINENLSLIGVNAVNMECSTVNGDLTVGNVKADTLEISQTNGDIKASFCSVGKLRISFINGSLGLSDCDAETLSASGVNGEISAMSCAFTAQSYETVNGNITASEMQGIQNDYAFNIDTVVGGVRINDMSMKHEFTTAGGKYTFSASTVSGDVAVHTKD